MTPQLPDLIKHIKQSLRPETKTLDSQRALFLQEAFLAPRFQRGVYQQFKNNRLSTRDRPNGLARRLTAE